MRNFLKFCFNLSVLVCVVVFSPHFSTNFVFASSPTSGSALVAMKPIESNLQYVGKALTQMFVTRLSSEGIDTVPIKPDGENETIVQLADFLFGGKVYQKGDHYEATFSLKSAKDGSVVKQWQLRAQTLDTLARDAALLSAKVADVVKNSGQVVAPESATTLSALSAPGADTVDTTDEFRMARLHPDILVREKLEKDEEREIEEQKRGLRPSATGGSAGDDYAPLPDVYDSGDDVTESDSQKAPYKVAGEGANGQQQEEEDYDSYMPIPDVYDPESDEGPSERIASSVPSKEVSATTSSKGEGKGKSWYSWLWPFGGDENKKKEELVSQAKKTRLENEEEDREPVVVSGKERLPLPPPPKVDFNIPEPVPLDRALSEIENIKVQKKEKKGWLSRLWPFGHEDEEVTILPEKGQNRTEVQDSVVQSTPQNIANTPATKKPSVDEGLHPFESGEQIEAFRRHLEMEDKPAEGRGHTVETPEVASDKAQGNIPVVTGGSVEAPKVESSSKDSDDESDKGPRPEDFNHPIWQWN